MAIPQHFIQIDEEGYPLSNELRVQDQSAGREILNNIHLHQGGTLLSSYGGTPVIIEAFDEPFVAQQVQVEDRIWSIILPYDLHFQFSLDTLSVDEWDRFHGYTLLGIPFVLSRAAQVEFFNLLDSFDDEGVTFNGKFFSVPPYWSDKSEVEKEGFWSDIYKTTENPGWNLGQPANALVDMMPRLKISKSRILVLGCGEGHDAAHFAKAGHVVTAVDISPKALEKARTLYGNLPNLTFMEADLFNLPQSFDKSFDIVFEHTCYCAINPDKRAQLVKVWNRLLVDGGHLMGVFFAFEKRQGPPFGGSEWELRQRLKNHYQPIFWGRLRNSVPNRQGKELFLYSLKK